MAKFRPLSNYLDKLIKAARQSLPRTIPPLPFLVQRSTWPEGENPGYKDWQRMEAGQSELTDREGFEEHNVEASDLARALRAYPKLYLFNPDEEGQDDRPVMEPMHEFEGEGYP